MHLFLVVAVARVSVTSVGIIARGWWRGIFAYISHGERDVDAKLRGELGQVVGGRLDPLVVAAFEDNAGLVVSPIELLMRLERDAVPGKILVI